MKTFKDFLKEFELDERFDKDLDKNKNGKLDAEDFKLLRKGKKKSDVKEEVELEEASFPEQSEVEYTQHKHAGSSPKFGKTSAGHNHWGIASTQNGKANILKHKDNGKFFAAGGSASGVTKNTTFHDTPEEAAQAYNDKTR